MWLLFWFLLFVVGACLIFLMPALWGREIYKHYRGSRAVMCPATHRQVAVSFDAFHAASPDYTENAICASPNVLSGQHESIAARNVFRRPGERHRIPKARLNNQRQRRSTTFPC